MLFCSGLLSTVSIVSAQNNQTDTLKNYYNQLLKGDEKDHQLLTTKMYGLLKSKKEDDWITASNFFYQLKMGKVSDSVTNAAKKKFPAGIIVRNTAVETIYNEPDPVQKEKLYQQWLQKYPPAKFGPERIIYDYARNSVSRAYAEADNVTKAVEYANSIESPFWKGEGWAGTAMTLIKKGHYTAAKDLLKKAIDLSWAFRTTRKTEFGAGFAATGYPGYLSTYVNCLYQEKQYDSALVYIRRAAEAETPVRAGVNEMYAKILIAKGDHQQAFERLSEIAAQGMLNASSKEQLEQAYTKIRGANGFEEYLDSLKGGLDEKIKQEMAKQIISEAAPDFTLTDVDGKAVSLSSLKGKTVILDFWATWCGPCKASFPAMKKAVEKYKNNPEVVFLFIHTWEKDNTAVANARSFVTNNHYPFEVLMDLKDPATGVNKVVDAYKVKGIPTKFVIDKQGNIRFRFTGFTGGEDAAVAEVTAMVTLANEK